MSEGLFKPEQPGGTPEADIDLYCLECGYNLRGLSGDPRRCPECGHLNPIGDVMLPAPLIKAQLLRMETSPAVCVGVVMLGVPAIIGLLPVLLVTGDPQSVICLATCILAWAAVWFIAVSGFRSSCMSKPGWTSALVTYHLYGLPTAWSLLAVCGVSLYQLTAVIQNDYRDLGGCVLLFALWALAAAIIFVAAPWAHARARASLDVLQRQVAIDLARHRLRRELGRFR